MDQKPTWSLTFLAMESVSWSIGLSIKARRPQTGEPNTKPGDHGDFEINQILLCRRARINNNLATR